MNKKTPMTLAALLLCASAAFAGSRAYELSTRGYVGTGDNVLIGGVIVGEPPDHGPCEDGGPDGKGPINFVLRALGPSLVPVGVPGTLADPTLELYDEGGNLVASQNSYLDNGTPINSKLAALGQLPGDFR
jgi:hypothetical protein